MTKTNMDLSELLAKNLRATFCAALPKLRQGSYFPGFLEARKASEQALVAVIQEAWIRRPCDRRARGHRSSRR